MSKIKINIFYILILLILTTALSVTYILFANKKAVKVESPTNQDPEGLTASVTLGASQPPPPVNTAKTVSSPVATKPAGLSSNDKQSPTVPKIASGKAVSDTQINITWSQSTDNIGVVGYKIYRNDVNIGTTQSTKFAFVGLSPETLYSFSVSAFDKANNVSEKSNEFALRTLPKQVAVATTTPNQDTAVQNTTPTTTPPVQQPIPPPEPPPPPPPPSKDTTSPTPPSDLTATSITSSQVNLKWGASSDNVGVTGYNVYRNGSKITTNSTTSYNDTGLSPSTTYSYTIYAYDSAGNTSTQSGSVTVTTKAGTAVPTTHTTTVSADGSITPSVLTIDVGDTVNFVYDNPNDEVILTFSPKPPSDIKLDAEITQESFRFTELGMWTYHSSNNTHEATIIVQ